MEEESNIVEKSSVSFYWKILFDTWTVLGFDPEVVNSYLDKFESDLWSGHHFLNHLYTSIDPLNDDLPLDVIDAVNKRMKETPQPNYHIHFFNVCRILVEKMYNISTKNKEEYHEFYEKYILHVGYLIGLSEDTLTIRLASLFEDGEQHETFEQNLEQIIAYETPEYSEYFFKFKKLPNNITQYNPSKYKTIKCYLIGDKILLLWDRKHTYIFRFIQATEYFYSPYSSGRFKSLHGNIFAIDSVQFKIDGTMLKIYNPRKFSIYVNFDGKNIPLILTNGDVELKDLELKKT